MVSEGEFPRLGELRSFGNHHRRVWDRQIDGFAVVRHFGDHIIGIVDRSPLPFCRIPITFQCVSPVPLPAMRCTASTNSWPWMPPYSKLVAEPSCPESAREHGLAYSPTHGTIKCQLDLTFCPLSLTSMLCMEVAQKLQFGAVP